MDLVYGNIRHFLTDEVLSSHNFFLGWGHLTLLRNDEDVNRYFMIKIDGYQYCKIERMESLYAHFQHRGYMKDRIKNYKHFLITPMGMVEYPKSNAAFWLRVYCLDLSIITKYYQWKDRIIYKLGKSKCR